VPVIGRCPRPTLGGRAPRVRDRESLDIADDRVLALDVRVFLVAREAEVVKILGSKDARDTAQTERLFEHALEHRFVARDPFVEHTILGGKDAVA